jgi:hypothetical protein
MEGETEMTRTTGLDGMLQVTLMHRVPMPTVRASERVPHNHGPNFGRKVDGCPRCLQLQCGAQPEKGWGYPNRRTWDGMRR